MKTYSIKLFLVVSFLLSLILVSCLKTETEETRTKADELSEISTLLTSAEDQGYTVEQTDLGVYYITYIEGEGDHPEEGDTLDIYYEAYFIDGDILDMSYYHYTDSIWTHIYQDSDESIIEGLDDALALTRPGSAHDFIIPSDLAYGADGTLIIPPYTPLIFRVEMRDIRYLSE